MADKEADRGQEEDFAGWATEFHRFYEDGTRAYNEFRFSRILILAGRRWTTRIDEIIRRKTGHTRARWQTLFAIAFAKEPVATLDLSERMGVQWPTLVRTLNDLEAEGLVERRMNPDDKRSRLIAITPEGRKVLRKVKRALDPLRAQLLDEFTDEELAASERILDRLFNKLQDL
jgi:MarR family transcriptional regulator, transcriptional regulator for hemolysin